MPKSVHKNLLLALLLFALAGFVFWQACLLPKVGTDLAVVDTAFLPKTIAVLLAVLAGILLLQKRNEEECIELHISPVLRRLLLFAAIIACFILLLPILRFELASIIFLSLTMYLLGMRRKWLLAILPAAVTAIVYIIFIHIMYVPFPSLLPGLSL